MRKPFAPNTRVIGRPIGPPRQAGWTADLRCGAATMIDGTPQKLGSDLVRILGEKQVR
jgi:hypothetical protein